MKHRILPVLFCAVAALVAVSCINPVGLPLSFDLNVSGEIGISGQGPDGTFPLVIKNLTGMATITRIAWRINGKTGGGTIVPPVNAGSEKLFWMESGNAVMELEVDDQWPNPPVTVRLPVTKAILPKTFGAANYMYLYRNANGNLQIDVDDTGKNVDPNTPDQPPAGTNPGEGTPTNPNTPIPSFTDEDYGIIRVTNLSGSADITGVAFENGPAGHGPWTMGQIVKGGGGFRETVLYKGTWTVKITYDPPFLSGNTSPNPLATQKVIIPVGRFGIYRNHIYFYMGTDGNYHITEGTDDPPGPGVVDSGDGPGGGGGGGNEGSSPGTLDPNNSTLGLLIVKNLSDKDVDSMAFGQAAQPSGFVGLTGTWPKNFSMSPGPGKGNQKSIVLGPGEWETIASYGTGAGQTPSRNAIILANAISYMYFYKTRSGNYSLTDSWNPAPADAATDNKDPTQVTDPDNELVHVVNASSSSTIKMVEYNSAGVWISVPIQNYGHEIPAGGSSGPDLEVPKNTWAFRFTIVGKQNPSNSTSKSWNSTDQRFQVSYTDSLYDRITIPPQASLVEITNNSSYSVECFYYYTVTSPDKKTVAASNFELDSTNNRKYSYTIMEGLTSTATQGVIQVILKKGSSRASLDFIDRLGGQTYIRIVIDDALIDQEGGTEIPGGADDIGILRVVNNYAGPYEMKIYQVKWTQISLDPDVTAPVTLPEGANPVTPGAGASYGKGAFWEQEMDAGIYHIRVVAGIYPADVYGIANNSVVTGVAAPGIHWTDIEYDLGEVYVPEKVRKTLSFAPPPGTELDMKGRQGVDVTVSYAGTSVGSESLIYLEVVIPPQGYWGRSSLSMQYPDDDISWTSWGGPGGGGQGHASSSRFTIYKNGTTLSSTGQNQGYSFKLPPGKYWIRAISASQWFVGRTGYSAPQNWVILDTSGSGGNTVFLTASVTNGIKTFGGSNEGVVRFHVQSDYYAHGTVAPHVTGYNAREQKVWIYDMSGGTPAYERTVDIPTTINPPDVWIVDGLDDSKYYAFVLSFRNSYALIPNTSGQSFAYYESDRNAAALQNVVPSITGTEITVQVKFKATMPSPALPDL